MKLKWTSDILYNLKSYMTTSHSIFWHRHIHESSGCTISVYKSIEFHYSIDMIDIRQPDGRLDRRCTLM